MKKIPLRIYFIGILGIVALVVAVMIMRRLYINHSFVNNYNMGIYDTEQEEKLLEFNFPQSYLPYYNLGNAAYKKGDYNSAIGYYNSALTMLPPEGKDCLIRINLALSMCNTINFYDLDTQEKVDTALFILYKARDVLTENGCASEEGHDGHNADAQQLKEDIDRMIEQLQNPEQNQQNNEQEQDSQSNNDSEGSSGSNSGPSDKEKKIQGELEGNKKDALEERTEQQDDMDKWSSYSDGDEDGGSGGSEDDGSTGGGGYVNPW